MNNKELVLSYMKHVYEHWLEEVATEEDKELPYGIQDLRVSQWFSTSASYKEVLKINEKEHDERQLSLIGPETAE